MPDWVAFSVDLEPNKDGSLNGVSEAMEWFDDVVPRGTVYATYRIATELPDVIERLATDHEIGVHVHPREFGYDHDQLAELDSEQQRELIARTRTALADAASVRETSIVTFRAGRHSASETTLNVLGDLGFMVDASVNINYTDYLPISLTRRPDPFIISSELLELPTTFGRPPLLSRLGLRTFPSRTLTATANTLRTDRRGTTGIHALRWLVRSTEGISFYMHPYDATDHHGELINNGNVFRKRFESLADLFNGEYLNASEVRARHRNPPA